MQTEKHRRHGSRFHTEAAAEEVVEKTIADVTRKHAPNAITHEIDVTDCALLQEVHQPSCSFHMDHGTFQPHRT
eukprot:1562737-Rhodomonas_salina.1